MHGHELVAAALLAAAPAGAAGPTLAEGRPFPALTLPALRDGRLRSTASFRGRKTLWLVFGSW